MTQGPRGSSICAKEYHLRLTEEQRRIIDDMGNGKPLDKFFYLIKKEGENTFPRDKILLKRKWLILREDAKEAVKKSQYARSLMIEIGFTEEEVRGFENEMDEVHYE